MGHTVDYYTSKAGSEKSLKPSLKPTLSTNGLLLMSVALNVRAN